jgi:hypothetical protein
MTLPQALRRVLAEGSVGDWLVAAPSAVLAIAAVWLGGAQLAPVSARDELRAEAGTFAEAIRAFGPEHVHAFATHGLDVNAPLRVVDDDLTGGRHVEVTPLVLAVAAQQENNMLTLLSAGARLDHPGNELAPCVAIWVRREDLRRALVEYGGAHASVACPAPPASGPVLAAFAP